MQAFYLKVNRDEDYALKNLSRWIDASFLMKADCYIICDDEKLEDKIKTELLIYRDITFLKSKKDGELNYIVDHIANRNWINAAYAHLTSFYHAYKKYEYFWNIDADDTRFCVSIDRMVEILLGVQEYAENNQVDCFSLDMWRSETGGAHWSFGISYINGDIDWLGICKERCCDEAYFSMEKEGNQNIDWFFTYLKQVSAYRIETFYVENMKFIHYSNDFFEKPIGSGMYHWVHGKLIYPITYYGLGITKLGEYEIADDIVKFDFDISDKEASEVLAYYAREGKDMEAYFNIDKLVNDEICKRKFDAFIRKNGHMDGEDLNVICFGAGNALEKNLKKIKKIYDLKYVCDNDDRKWGQELYGGIKCISPEELRLMRNAIVVVLVYSKRIMYQIMQQLDEMDIQHVSMDSLFACVE